MAPKTTRIAAISPSARRRQWLKAAIATGVTAPWAASVWAANPVEGVEYQKLPGAVQTEDASKVEVLEFMWLGCPHCYEFEPLIASWRQKLPPSVLFRQVHVDWREEHQKLFYTLQALNRGDLITKAFQSIHQEKKTLSKMSALLEFAQANGIAEALFTSTYNSFGVSTAVQRANKLIQRYAIKSVPQIVVNGRYLTSPAMTQNSNAQALAVVDWLIAREQGGKK